MERALGALRDFTRRDILLRFYADRKARSVDDVSREIHRSERTFVQFRCAAPGRPTAIGMLDRWV